LQDHIPREDEIMAIVRTVLGDIEAEKLGITMLHEHIVSSWGSARHDLGDTYNAKAYVDKASVDVEKARDIGGLSCIVDCSPPDLGRDVETMVAVSRRTGVHIVAATGFYKSDAGYPSYWQISDTDSIEAHFAGEITNGVGPDKVRCGIVKLATALDKITASEERALRAAARVQKKLGVGIYTHTDPEGWQSTNIGMKQAEILLSEGADPSRCVIGHACGTRNLSYLLSIVEKGFSVGIDRIGWVRPPLMCPDEERMALVAALVISGYTDRVILSQDHLSVWVPRFPMDDSWEIKDFSHLFSSFIPKLRKGGISQSAIKQMMVDNPRRILSLPKSIIGQH
jgi:phosphotriesterase-related protein